MIAGSGKDNFFKAHYDWVAAGVGVVALLAAAAYFAMSLGVDPDAMAAADVANVDRMRPHETGVKAVDMSAFQIAIRAIRNPATVSDVADKAGNFLASERRVFCSKCKKVIPGDTKVFPNCPHCGEKQQEEKPIVVDADGDGLPDDWERKNGLNPNDAADADADADGDGFTNAEEFAAKTNPLDKNDHPDYLDSVTVQLPLRETYMPFIFIGSSKIPAGWRCEFYDAKQKDDYGRLGRKITAIVGDEVGKSGFVLKKFEHKEKKEAIKGGQGMARTVDVSEATVERKADGKSIVLVMARNRKTKPAPVDVQASLVYTRGTAQNFDVVPGSEIELNGTKYKVVEIKAVGKGASVTFENLASGKKRTLEALEP